MDRRMLSLVVMGLMLFSVFLVHPVAAAGTNGSSDVLRVIYYAPHGSLFMSVFNPSPAGLTGFYVMRIWYFLNDQPYVTLPNTHFADYKCQLVSVQHNVKVPADAIIWNGTQRRWIAQYAGKTAQSAVTWKCGLGQWQDGQPITLADYLYSYAMDWEWSYQNGKNDPYYDEYWSTSLRSTIQSVLGFKVDKLTNDYVEYTLYQSFSVPFSNWSTAVGNYMELPIVPWELFNTMTYMVAQTNEGKKVEGKAFSWSSIPTGGYQIDMLNPSQMKYFVYAANYIMNNEPIPMWLNPSKSLGIYLEDWGITAEQAGISVNAAKAGYQAEINWINKYHNALIADGPYYVASYNPSSMILTLKRSTNKRIGFPGTVTLGGKTYQLPWDPYWDEIDIYGTLDQQTAMLAVAKGDYDFFWTKEPYDQLESVVQEYGDNISLIKSMGSWWAISFNPVGSSTTGIIQVNGTWEFNPFALEGVRYAMNWLVSRDYIVNNILQGAGAPIYGPEVPGQTNAYSAIYTVASALGMTAQGDEQYAIKLIDQSMEKAAQALKAKGYILAKQNGYWYFNGQPVTVTVIARTDDHRLDEGKYFAQLLQQVGFKVNLEEDDRSVANNVVYLESPKTLQWQAYTERWITTGIEPITWLAWDWWVFDYYYAPTPTGGFSFYSNTTVADLLKKVGNGNLEAGIKALNLRYYADVDRIKPLLNWTGYDVANLLAFNSWRGPNNVSITITNLSQFWDLYKLGAGITLIDSPRIYTVTPFSFFVTNKNMVKAGISDPVSGLGNFLAIRSLMPPTATLPSTTGILEITSYPSGATVLLNGKYEGTTPLTLNVSPGTYRIEISKQGYKDYETTLSLSAGEHKTISVTLTPMFGYLTVTSTPSGASVYIDGKYAGTTPLENYKLSTGDHTVKVEKAGYETYTTRVDVSPGATSTVSATLHPLPVKVSITSQPSGASVYINGVYKGTTPLTLSLTPGTYDVKVIKNGYETWEKSVTVEAGSPLKLAMSLTALPPTSSTSTSSTTSSTSTMSTTSTSTTSTTSTSTSTTSTTSPASTSNSNTVPTTSLSHTTSSSRPPASSMSSGRGKAHPSSMAGKSIYIGLGIIVLIIILIAVGLSRRRRKRTIPGFPPELLGKYEPLEFLGEGGFAKVFKVKRRKDGRIVAVKIPHLDEKAKRFFLKEVKAWKLLDHPNIVKLYGAYDQPTPHLEMEYVDGVIIAGEIIRDLGKHPKPVDEETALRVVRGIAEGLKHAHYKSVYHRDLKPQNILITRDLTPKITDWGLAKVGTFSTTATAAKALTFLYATPEQLDSETYGHTDHRTDIYQLGLIFYELLTGRLPYTGSSITVVIGKIASPSVRPEPPSRVNPDLAKYDGIFEKLLAKRKEDRYQSIEEFLEALDAVEKLDRRRKKLEEEIEKTKTTMTMTTNTEDLRKLTGKLIRELSENALLHAQLNDKAGLINALEDLKAFSKKYSKDLDRAIKQIELMIREEVPIGNSTIEELRVLLHEVQTEVNE